MSIDDLRAFLETEQGICASRELCLEIINECEPSAQLREKEMLGIDGFTRLVYDIRKLLIKQYDIFNTDRTSIQIVSILRN